jgi:toxin ParE1/3/4
MSLTVVFSPEAEAQLLDLYNYIAAESSSEIAVRYTDGIVSYCESLCVFPHRGVLREDLRPGLRVTGYRKRVAIAFVVASHLQGVPLRFGHCGISRQRDAGAQLLRHTQVQGVNHG